MSRNKTDKIFDNTFDESGYSGESAKFKISNSYVDSEDAEGQLYDGILIKKLDELIRGSEYSKLNKLSKDGKPIKLSKLQMNEIYTYVINNIKDFNKVDIFSIITDYFNIQSTKFYNSLSNSHKEDLIIELDKRLNILERKRITKLF